MDANICRSDHRGKHFVVAGWNFPATPVTNQADRSFVMRVPPNHLFNMFNDYQLVQFGRQTIRLVRSGNDYGSIITTNDATADVKIENISLPIVLPNDILKLQLLESIKADRPIITPFRKWEFHELPQLTKGSQKEIWDVKTCAALESSRYVILVFQTDKRGKASSDVSRFNHIDVSDIRVMLNSEYYIRTNAAEL